MCPPLLAAVSSDASEPAREDAGWAVVVVGPGDVWAEGDVDITRDGLFGNPFRMLVEGDREGVVAAYGELLSCRSGVREIAGRRHVSFSKGAERVRVHKRMEGLSRLAERARGIVAGGGSPLRLRCVCAPRKCHGDVIREWVLARTVARSRWAV